MGDQGTALATVQDTAAGLLGSGTPLDAKKAISIAKTAIDGGRKIKAMMALLKAGPSAAEAASVGGQVASKATVWGWVATAAYAAGTGSWFAYNLRSFNLAAYEARRVREGLEAHPDGPSLKDLAAAGLTTVANAATDGAKAVGHGASATVDAVGHGTTIAITAAAKGGGWLYGAASGLFRRNSAPSATENADPHVPGKLNELVKSIQPPKPEKTAISFTSSGSGLSAYRQRTRKRTFAVTLPLLGSGRLFISNQRGRLRQLGS